MANEKLVMIANFLQGGVPLLSLFAYFPQWRKIVANRSSKDISLTSWLVWLLSSAIAIFYAVMQYAITGKGTALIFSSALALVFVSITLCLVIWFRKSRQPLDWRGWRRKEAMKAKAAPGIFVSKK